MMASDRAPGLQRERWGFMGWLGHDADLWQEVRVEAQRRARLGLEQTTSRFLATISIAACWRWRAPTPAAPVLPL